MPAIPRTWLAFAAVGAGLIHFALVLGSPLPLGLVLAFLGITEFGWGVLTFAREQLVAPRVALVVALVPVAAWALLLVASSSLEDPQLADPLPFLPLAIASLFELVAAALLGTYLRQWRQDPAPPAPALRRYLLGVAAGALVVGALTVPAIAAAQAGPPPTPGFDLPDHGH